MSILAKRNNVPRDNKTFIYDYGDGIYKVVQGNFRQSGWVEDNPKTSQVNDILLKSSSSASARSRARSRIFELARCNPWQYFYTQTFNMKLIDRFSIEHITNKIQEKIKYYKKHYNKDFKFLFVCELHKKTNEEGKHAIHLHGLIMGLKDSDLYINKNGYLYIPYFDKALGFNSISIIENLSNCSKYITKYITKDSLQFSNGYYYLCSRGLNRALVSRVELSQDLNLWKKFDYVKIYDLDLTSKNFNVINENREDLLTIFNAKDVNTGIIGSIRDCVKLRFNGIYQKLYEEGEQ